MDTETDSLTTGNESSDLDNGSAEPLGGSGLDGAATRDQGAGGADETSAKNQPAPDNSTSDDDDAAFIKALADGDLDTVDTNGKPIKPKAEPEKSETSDPAKDAEPPAEKAEEKPKEDEKKPDDPDKHLTDADKAEIAQAPKGYRIKMRDLLRERAEIRANAETIKQEAESLKPVKQFTDNLIKHASDAGLVKVVDGKVDTTDLQAYIEEHRMLQSMPPQKVYEYFMGLAHAAYPEGKPVTIPADLKEMVEIGTLSEEDAKTVVREREAKAAKPQEEARRQREAAASKEAEVQRAKQAEAAKAVRDAGYEEMNQVAIPFQKHFGAEWDGIKETVKAELLPLLEETNPKAWAKLAKTVIEGVVARRKAVPMKKPPTTPPPQQTTSTTKRGEVMSEEEENRRLAAGTL